LTVSPSREQPLIAGCRSTYWTQRMPLAVSPLAAEVRSYGRQRAATVRAGIMRGVTVYPTKSSRLPSPWLAGLVFLGSLLPGLVALLPLTLGSSWYFADPSNARFLSPGRVWFMLVLFSIAMAPFLAAAVSLVSVGLVRRDLSLSFLVSAAWAGGLGLMAVVAAALSSGGF